MIDLKSFRAWPFAQKGHEIGLSDWLIANRFPTGERRRNGIYLNKDVDLRPFFPNVVIRVVPFLLHFYESVSYRVQMLE